MARFQCEVCGQPSIERLCWKHKKHKTIPTGRIKGQPKGEEEKERMFQLFFEIWDERQGRIMDRYIDYSYNMCAETGKELPTEQYKMLTTCYHHLLEKKSYPDLIYCKENIVILHPDTHLQVHQDIDKTPIIKKMREEIFKKYINGEI